MHIFKKIGAITMSMIIALSSLASSKNTMYVNAEEIYVYDKLNVYEEPKILVNPTINMVVIMDDISESYEEELETLEAVTKTEISDQELELLALVVMAEAEGETDEGKRWVIDTILNRVDSERFDDNITEVIYSPGQFSSVWNGRMNRCYISDDIISLINEELYCRTTYEPLYFTANRYSNYGTPITNIGNHYFSK